MVKIRRELFLVGAAVVLIGPVCVVHALPQPGQIVVDADHPAWFKYAEGGPFYLCGPGDPEGFLYLGTRNPDGTRTGNQMTLISKMAGTGANCIYLIAVRSHGGDGDASQNPYVDSDLAKGLDNDILNQWENWFTAMDNSGIVIFFFFYDDSAKPFGKELPVGGQLKPEEAAFIDGMVIRFKHHKHLIWCVAEEYAEALSSAHASRIAQRIKSTDDRQHPVAIHQNHGTSFNFNGESNFDQFAVQWNVATAAELHAGALAAWNNTGGLVNINLSEFADPGTGMELQRKLWAIATGGAYAMVLGMDIESTDLADLQTCGRLVRFMEATRFNETVPRDDLAAAGTGYVLANPGRVYIAYGESASALGVQMLPGNYEASWYDPASGAWITGGRRPVTAAGVQQFTKPAGIGQDVALYLYATVPAPANSPLPPVGAKAVRADATLSWTAGAGADTHEVYFGKAPPGALAHTGPQATFDPGPLEPLTTYYWRVDELNEAGRTQGATWTFETASSPGDLDHDGDVDQEDFGLFQVCLTASAEPAILDGCEQADLNQDQIVSQADGLLFLGCMSGPGKPADPSCR